MAITNEEFQLAMEHYENELTQERRKKDGVYFTDYTLAKLMIEELHVCSQSSMLDPTCGMGIFLRCAHDLGFDNLYGCDIDETSIDFCKKNGLGKNLVVYDSINNSAKDILSKLGCKEHPDVVIGNPPYVPLKKQGSINGEKTFNAYVKANGNNLFVAALIRALNLVKQGGVVSFIIPKNFLHVKGYSNFRREILSKKTIIEIVDLGVHFKSVRGEQIVLTIKNEIPKSDTNIIFKHYAGGKFVDLTAIPQNVYSDEIIIFGSQEDLSLYKKFNTEYPRLGDNTDIEIYRGHALSPDVNGKDIRKFGLKEIPVEDKGNQIFVQNIYSAESGIIGAFGGDKLAGETVTIIKDTNWQYCKFLLGVIHSRVCNLFLYKFCYNSSVVTMHTDAMYLKSLPLPSDVNYRKYKDKVVEYVSELEKKEYMSDEWMRLYEDLNNVIYKAYGITKSEQKYIEEEIRKFQSDKWFLNKIKHSIPDDKRCNDLDGKGWLQNSFSIWRGMGKTLSEKSLKHPASYPVSLCRKVIESFTKPGCYVIDPFNGIGSTMVAAEELKRKGLGIDLSKEYCDIAKSRISNSKDIQIICGNSFEVLKNVSDNSVDLCLTSPPYWDILNMKRTVDEKKNVNYSDKNIDVGNISDYDKFLDSLRILFMEVRRVLKPGGYCIINVMDLRKKSNFYCLHMDLTRELQSIAYTLDDIIIWDRQAEYNNMKTLGYPYKFRINKVHEYLLIFTK